MAHQQISNRGGRRTTALRAALLVTGSALTGVIAITPAAAQQIPATADVNVSAGSLDAGLKVLSQQTGVQLIYGSDIVAGKATPGASGRLSVEAAVAQLLRGTGLTFRVVNGRTIQIELPAPGEEGERVLGAVRVEGTQDDGVYVPATRGDGIAQLGGIRGRQDQEVDGYRPRVATVGTGAQMAIEDIPRSISVVTPEQKDKQDIITLDDALARLPGVTIQQRQNQGSVGNNNQIFVRGSRIQSYQVDGGTTRSLTDNGNATLNLDSYDRVELVRGPNALFAGADSPGGSINLVRKRAGAAPSQSITLEGGNYGRVGAVADFSVPSVFGSPIAFRTVASVHRNDSIVDDFKSSNYLLYGIFDAPLGDSARLEFGGQYSVFDQQGENNGNLRTFDGILIDLGRNFNYAKGNGGFLKSTAKEIFGKLNIDLKNDWDFEASGYYRDVKRDYQQTSISANIFANQANGLPPFSFPFGAGSLTVTAIGPTKSTELGGYSKVTGRFDTFGLTHNVFGSINYTRTDSGSAARNGTVSRASFSSLAALASPVYTPVTGAATPIYAQSLLAQTSIILSDSISWRDIVTLTGSVRRDTIDLANVALSRNAANIPQTILLNRPITTGTWRPSYSLAIKPFKRLTLFGSYADGFIRQDDRFSRTGTAPNFIYEQLRPSTFKNKEIGIKYGADRWTASVTAYDLQQFDVGTAVSGISCPNAVNATALNAQCFIQDGSFNKSRGIDAEFNGQVAKGLSVVTNVNYNKSTANAPLPTAASPDPARPPLASFAPQTSAGLFINWNPSFAPRFGVDIGARYKSRYFSRQRLTFLAPTPTNPNNTFSPADPTDITQGSYVTVDLGVDYQFSDALRLRLYVENITDRKYLSTIVAGNGNFFGEPRTFLATLTYKNVGAIPADGQSPTTGLAPFGDPADWYAAFDAGYNIAGDLDAEAEGKAQNNVDQVRFKFETENAPAFAGRLGYHFSDNLRGELELKYRRAEFGDVGGATVAPFGVCGAVGSTQGTPFNCDDVPGRTDNWSLVANVLYDLGSRDAVFRPFVGVGAGLSRNSVDFQGKLEGIGGTTPFSGGFAGNTTRLTQESIGGVSTKTSLTWQGIAGASLRLSDRLHVDLTYRYVSVPNMKFTSYNLDVPAGNGGTIRPLTPRIGTFKADYNSSMATIGLRWAFGSKAPR